MNLDVINLGLCEYSQALVYQYRMQKKREQEIIDDTLLLVEHPAVITLGKNADKSNLIVSEPLLNRQGISVCRITRGGDITYHGPGQLVGYPIIDLGTAKYMKSVRRFVETLEEVFVQLLKREYDIQAGRLAGHTGVWVGGEKITAIGIAVNRWITMHGFAFNVRTNLSHFKWIVPCGITDKGVTSLEKLLGEPVDFFEVLGKVRDTFAGVFGYDSIREIQPDPADFSQTP